MDRVPYLSVSLKEHRPLEVGDFLCPQSCPNGEQEDGLVPQSMAAGQQERCNGIDLSLGQGLGLFSECYDDPLMTLSY